MNYISWVPGDLPSLLWHPLYGPPEIRSSLLIVYKALKTIRPGALRGPDICPNGSIAKGPVFILPLPRVSIFIFMLFITVSFHIYFYCFYIGCFIYCHAVLRVLFGRDGQLHKSNKQTSKVFFFFRTGIYTDPDQVSLLRQGIKYKYYAVCLIQGKESAQLLSKVKRKGPYRLKFVLHLVVIIERKGD